MHYHEYIEITPGKRSGKPCIKGTRISVYDVLDWLSLGMSADDIVHDYPELTVTHVHACLAFAAKREHSLSAVSAA